MLLIIRIPRSGRFSGNLKSVHLRIMTVDPAPRPCIVEIKKGQTCFILRMRQLHSDPLTVVKVASAYPQSCYKMAILFETLGRVVFIITSR